MKLSPSETIAVGRARGTSGKPGAADACADSTARAASSTPIVALCLASIVAPHKALRARFRPRRSGHYDAPVRYPVENFSDEERALLAPHFTNLDRPVFALVNLPETVKGALFARYSRYSGTVRRLYLEEFAGEREPRHAALRRRPRASARRSSTSGSSSATATTRSPRSAAPTSPASGSPTSSPRCCSAAASPPTSSSRPATSPTTSRCPRRTAATATTATSELGPEFGAAMDELFSIYSRSLRQVEEWAAERWPRGDGEPEGPWQRSIRAKALDLLRGLLPAATLSHVGIYASGQAYEQLLLRLMASPLPEAREYGGMILARAAAGDAELRLAGRAARPRRRVGRLPAAAPRATEQWVSRLGLDRRGGGEATPSVELVHVDGTEEDLLASCLFESAARPRPRSSPASTCSTATSGPSCSAAMVGERANRRHRPGRGFEALRYRFEIVSDYGAFRDLQRHRMLTCQWQRLGPDLGAGVPEEVREAGAGDEFERALEISRDEYERLDRRRPRRARRPTRSASPTGSATPRPQRPRGDAPDRAALRPRGPPHLPRRRPGDARADRRDPPRRSPRR